MEGCTHLAHLAFLPLPSLLLHSLALAGPSLFYSRVAPAPPGL